MYDGAPDYPGPDRLWSFVERHRVNVLGVSPTLIRALMAHGDAPVRAHDLSSLRILASTGEPWNEVPWRWYFDVVGGGRCPVVNISGGTEVGACFLSPHVVQPLSPCSLGGPALGMAIDVFDENGQSVRGEVGELVCTKPWPGMTRGLYNDPERYLDTYWSRYPGVWWHGDFASVSDDGQWFLHGRSDDTIKVAGKRLGPGRGRDRGGRASVGARSGRGRCARRAEGRGVVGVRRARRRASCPTTRCGPSWSRRWSTRSGRRSNPREVRFTTALPKTRSAKVLRRAIRSVVTGAEPGDLSGLEDPAALDAIAAAIANGGGAVVVTRADRFAGHAAAVARRRLGRVARGAAAVPGLAGTLGAAARRRAASIPRSIARRSVRGAARGTASATSTPRTASGCSCSTVGSSGEVSLGQRAARPVPDGLRRLLDRRSARRAAATSPKVSC